MLPETELYLERLNALRVELWKTLDGLDAAALNWAPLAQDTNSLFVLATHSLGAEHGWISELVGGAPKTRVRASEFQVQGSNLDNLRAQYQVTARETERVLMNLSEDDMGATREPERGRVTVRWIILHVIEHYSEHLGQMRLTRQLWEHRG